MRKGSRSTWEKKNATNVYCVFFIRKYIPKLGIKPSKKKQKRNYQKQADMHAIQESNENETNKKQYSQQWICDGSEILYDCLAIKLSLAEVIHHIQMVQNVSFYANIDVDEWMNG